MFFKVHFLVKSCLALLGDSEAWIRVASASGLQGLAFPTSGLGGWRLAGLGLGMYGSFVKIRSNRIQRHQNKPAMVKKLSCWDSSFGSED